jgi:hypothetical protein
VRWRVLPVRKWERLREVLQRRANHLQVVKRAHESILDVLLDR